MTGVALVIGSAPMLVAFMVGLLTDFGRRANPEIASGPRPSGTCRVLGGRGREPRDCCPASRAAQCPCSSLPSMCTGPASRATGAGSYSRLRACVRDTCLAPIPYVSPGMATHPSCRSKQASTSGRTARLLRTRTGSPVPPRADASFAMGAAASSSAPSACYEQRGAGAGVGAPGDTSENRLSLTCACSLGPAATDDGGPRAASSQGASEALTESQPARGTIGVGLTARAGSLASGARGLGAGSTMRRSRRAMSAPVCVARPRRTLRSCP